MSSVDDIVTSEDLRTLADIGFIASSRGMNSHARAMFAALRGLRPEQEVGYLGEAVVSLLSGNPGLAITTLKKAPETSATQSFLGLALLQEGNRTAGEKVLNTIAEAEKDTPFAHLAQDALTHHSA